MKCDNINNRNEIIPNSEDKKYSKLELLNRFKSFIKISGYSIIGEIDSRRSPYVALIKKDEIKYKIIMFYKNITGAGWSHKPQIKRVQVANVRKNDISKYVGTSNNETFVILGYYNYDNNPIMVAWNAYNYVYHDTIRSCYVDVKTLIEGYKSGYLKTTYSKHKIWVFTSDYFDDFLNDYISINKVG